MKFIKYRFERNSSTWANLVGIRPYLEELGITHDSKVIILPDITFNFSLFLVDRKGWTNKERVLSKEVMERYIHKGAEYLIIYKGVMEQTDFLDEYSETQIGEFQGVKIYKLE